MRGWRSRLVAVAAVVLLTTLAVACGSSGGGEASAAQPLSDVLTDSHAHSLMVDPANSRRLWLGLHTGLYRSDDGGRRWRAAGLQGDDAMNLQGGGAGGPLWVAGHEVLMRSDDRGGSWSSVRPDGLPGLDLHGFAVRVGRPGEIAAAVAGQGLFRSRDGGRSFAPLSTRVGATVYGMAMTRDGTLFAADPEQGLVMDPGGRSDFRLVVQGQGLVSVAAHPQRPSLVLAAGEPGIVVSRDGGRSWTSSFTDAAVAAVAMDPRHARRAYAVGMDGRLYATRDGARTWAAVG